MASYHLSVKTIKRSAGRSATAAAAYRSASVIACDREGRMHDYTAKRGVEACFILAPADAPSWAQDRAALWNAAEARETRSNSVTAREWELALPSEVSDAARIEIARAFAQQLVERYGVAADVAKRLHVHRLNLHGTGLGDMGIPIPQIGAFAPGMEQRARDTLHRICDLAEAQDQVFTLENLNPIDHPGCPFGSTAAVLGLVSAVNRPQLRINLDLYHTQIGEGDLIRWCQACLPWIGEVQVADNPGRCEPGTGEINFAGVAKALTEMGYSGPVGMEAWASGDAEVALEAFRGSFTI